MIMREWLQTAFFITTFQLKRYSLDGHDYVILKSSTKNKKNPFFFSWERSDTS